MFFSPILSSAPATVAGWDYMATGRVVLVTAGDHTCQGGDWRIYVNQATPGPTRITLPTAPTTATVVVVKDARGDAAAHPITVVGATIDGQASFTINENYQCQEFGWNGNEWSAQ